MNKKNLSVVMAGAMLATSVAPVMAAVENHEVHLDNRGILISELRSLLSKKFADVKENKEFAGKTVYKVTVDGKEVSTTAELEKAIKEAKKGAKVVVSDKGHQEVNGKFYHYAQEAVAGKVDTWTKASLAKVETLFNADELPSVYKVTRIDDSTIEVLSKKADSENTHLKFVCKVGEERLDFKKPLDEAGKVATPGNNGEWDTVVGYAKVVKGGAGIGVEIKEKAVAEITLTDVDAKHDVKLSELYDGLLLTAKGQELLDAVVKHKVVAGTINQKGKGVFELSLEFNVEGKKVLVSIKSNNNEQITTFRNFLKNGKASVEVLAGDNRYETAVKVAKENASIKDVAYNGNIVLVNGNALVDGLAAAPLAASVVNKVGSVTFDNFVAPILLTEADSLPKATLDYMRELVKYQTVGELDKVTVYLVGGESVLSPALARQLKEIGVRVVRAGGDNREETSLAVAKLMERENGLDPKNAFVVGADGEADAMSIASVAAMKKQPIIVSKKGGLSDDAVDYLKGGKSQEAMKATLVGGKAVVSEATEAKLKEEKISVSRIAGANRQATNAEVINKYYSKGFHRFVLSKDGQGNKSHLVDALTATSLAVKHKSPIVLATNNLSKPQVNALELAAKRDNYAQNKGFYVYQVGHGVSRNVLQTIAERLGLAYK